MTKRDYQIKITELINNASINLDEKDFNILILNVKKSINNHHRTKSKEIDLSKNAFEELNDIINIKEYY